MANKKAEAVAIEGTGRGPLAVGKVAAVHPEVADRLIKRGFAKKRTEKAEKE
jgi:hypothetical protein